MKKHTKLLRLGQLFVLLGFTLFWTACSSDDDNSEPDMAPAEVELDVEFVQLFDGSSISSDDFDDTVFTNELGQKMTFSRIRYLISRITLTDADSGEEYEVPGYRLVDMADENTFDYDPGFIVPEGRYRISFVYGFNEEDNTDGAYPDLNAASWNWPMMLGGGYHFLQMDGLYDVDTATPKPFNYHNGTARVSDGVFEQNFYLADFPEVFEIDNDDDDDSIEITMDIAEWFRDPYTWDLDVYNTPLMPDYGAQKLMNQNVRSVFSVDID